MSDSGQYDLAVSPGAELQTLAEGFRFIEGPVWIRDHLIFSDIPASRMHRWSPTEGVKIFREPTGQANGNTVDAKGRLLTCHHESRIVTRTELDGSLTTLADKYQGGHLNSPNDVTVKSDGTIWFTDPTYGLGKRPSDMAQRWVFRMNEDGSDLTPMLADAVQPNGLCFSPDESVLYVVDSGSKPSVIRAYQMQNNRPVDGKIFCTIDHGVADGIRCDTQGRLYAGCGDGVQIFNPDGSRIARILVPQVVTNLCFGGPDFDTLYMTGTTTLYSIKLSARGAGVAAQSTK